MPQLDPETQKQAMKEALTEWLDAKFAQFGKWSLGAIAAMALVGVVYLFFSAHGWKP